MMAGIGCRPCTQLRPPRFVLRQLQHQGQQKSWRGWVGTRGMYACTCCMSVLLTHGIIEHERSIHNMHGLQGTKHTWGQHFRAWQLSGHHSIWGNRLFSGQHLEARDCPGAAGTPDHQGPDMADTRHRGETEGVRGLSVLFTCLTMRPGWFCTGPWDNFHCGKVGVTKLCT